jgi:hypothetical protein
MVILSSSLGPSWPDLPAAILYGYASPLCWPQPHSPAKLAPGLALSRPLLLGLLPPGQGGGPHINLTVARCSMIPVRPRSQIVLGNATFRPHPAWAPPLGARAPRPTSACLCQFSLKHCGTMRHNARNSGLCCGTKPKLLRYRCGTNRNICGTNRNPKRTNRNISGTFRQISGTRTATFSLIGTRRRFTRVQVYLKRRAKIVSS